MAYTFRLNVIENITRVGGDIGATFVRMKQSADRFVGSVGKVPASISMLNERLSQLKKQQRDAFNIFEVQRYGREMAAVERQMARMQGLKGPGVRPSFSMPLAGMGGFGGMVAGVGAAIGGIEAAKGVTRFNDSLVTSQSLIQSIMRTEEGVAAAMAKSTEMAGPLNLSRQQSLDAMSKMLTLTKGNVNKAGHLLKVGQALAAINPAEGFEAALFSLKELEGGDTVSLRERFNIRVPTTEEAKKIAARDGRSVQQVMLDSLQQYLDKTYGGGKEGAGVDALISIKTKTIGGQIERIKNIFKDMFAPVAMPALEKVSGFLKATGDWIEKNKGGIMGAFTGAQAALAPIFEGLGSGFQKFSAFVISMWPTVSNVFKSIGRFVAAILPPIIQVGSTILSVLRPALVFVGQLISWLLNGISGFFERNRESIMSVIGGIGSVLKVILGAVMLVGRAGVWLWTEMYKFGQNMVKLGEWLYQFHPFQWIPKVLNSLFPELMGKAGALLDGIKRAFSTAADWIWNTFIKPLSQWLSKIWEGLGLGALNFTARVDGGVAAPASGDARAMAEAERDDTKMSETQRRAKAEEDRSDTRKPVLGSFAGGSFGSGGGNANLTNVGVSEKAASVSGGGREGIKNISFNIKSLIERQEFHTVKSMDDISSIVRREMERLLLQLTNDATIAI